MTINNIVIKNEGFVHCKSRYYSAQDSLSKFSCYSFSRGINKLIGDIDTGNFAISYLLSMYKHRPEDFVLFDDPIAAVNNNWISLNKLSEYSCYMDTLDPLFSTSFSVKKCIIDGLDYSKMKCSYDCIKKLFYLDDERFDRPLNSAGNDIFKSMAAIGFAYNKDIYCFPWLSKKRFESYHENLIKLLELLDRLNKIIIVPVGISS